MTHTPGPWTAYAPQEPPENQSDYWEVHDGFGRTATVYGHTDPAQANARLIAAAPDLLSTLQTIADFAPGNGDVCEIIAQRARAAIDAAMKD